MSSSRSKFSRISIFLIAIFVISFSIIIVPVKNSKAATETNWSKVTTANFSDWSKYNVSNGASIVYNGYLYISTLTKLPSTTGHISEGYASIWRTNDGNNWEKMPDPPFFGWYNQSANIQEDYFPPLQFILYKGAVYVGVRPMGGPICQVNESTGVMAVAGGGGELDGCKFIWKTTDFQTWTGVIFNNSFKPPLTVTPQQWKIYSMESFSGFAILNDKLYASFSINPYWSNDNNDQQQSVVVMYDGNNWSKAYNGTGVGTLGGSFNTGIFSFKGDLYIGIKQHVGDRFQDNNTKGQIWKKDPDPSLTWNKVSPDYLLPSGSDQHSLEKSISFTGNPLDFTLRTHSRDSLSQNYYFSNSNITLMMAHNNVSDKSDLLCSENGSSWNVVAVPSDLSVGSKHIDSIASFSNKIYIGLENTVAGSDVFSTDNITSCSGTFNWTKSNSSSGFGDSSNHTIKSLIEFNGYLYAITGNYNNTSSYLPSQVWRIGGSNINATLTITLPSKTILDPKQIKFAGGTPVDISCGSTPDVKSLSGGYTLTTTLKTITSPATDSYCEMKITGFKRVAYNEKNLVNQFADLINNYGHANAQIPPPATNALMLSMINSADFKITFHDEASYLSSTNLSNLLTLATNAGGNFNNQLISDGAGFLKLKTKVELDDSGISGGGSYVTYLTETIPMKDILIEGNIAASGNINTASGRIVDITKDALVIAGGTVNNVNGTNVKTINGYVMDWSKTTDFLNSYVSDSSKFDRQADGPYSYKDKLNLYSTNNNIANTQQDTFSSPPEGQTWYVGGNLTLGNTTFSNRGTLYVNGSLNINGTLTCDTGADFGIIAKGAITFASGSGTKCGALVSLHDSIDLSALKSGTVNSILAANQSIILPAKNNLIGPLFISNDKNFTTDPTVLFKEVLSFITPGS